MSTLFPFCVSAYGQSTLFPSSADIAKLLKRNFGMLIKVKSFYFESANTEKNPLNINPIFSLWNLAKEILLENFTPTLFRELTRLRFLDFP